MVAAQGATGARVNWVAPTSTGVTLSVSSQPGNFFQIGNTLVSYKYGGSAFEPHRRVCAFIVTVTEP